MAFHLEVLGGLRLIAADGREVQTQRRRLALLALLAAAGERGLTRDELVGFLWSEATEDNAKHALNQLVYGIRRSLNEDALRGVDPLRIDAAVVDSDVQRFERALSAGAYADAVAHYGGVFLSGFHLADAPEFERRVERERARLAAAQADAIERLAAEAERHGDAASAAAWARTLAELDPLDARRATALMRALVAAGDSTGALAHSRMYEALVRSELDAPADPAVVALASEIRAGTERPSMPSAAPVVSPHARPRVIDDASAPFISAAPAAANADTRATRRRVLIGGALAATALVAVALASLLPVFGERDAIATSAGRTLVVLPMANETGNPKLAYIATGIADGVARRLGGLGGITIRSGARSDWSDSVLFDMPAIGRQFGATILLRSILRRAGDSLEVHASVVDASTSSERTVAGRRFSTSNLLDAESKLAADVAGAVFRAPLPAMPRTSDRMIHPESYRLTLEGLHLLNSNPEPREPGTSSAPNAARDLLSRAVNIDPLNARAWSGLSAVWGSQAVTGHVPFDEGYDRSVAAATRALAIDSMDGVAWANLALMRAFRNKSVAAGMELMKRAEAAEPSNPEVFRTKSAIFRSAHLYDQDRDAVRIARRLDPLTSNYLDREAMGEICADRPEVALELYQSELAMNPSDRLARAGLIRSFALLGRYDDAITLWRQQARAAGDTAVSRALAGVKGAEGYWRVKHEQGRKRLALLQRQSGRVSPVRLMQARWASGDADGGFRALDEAVPTGAPVLYRLRCMPDADEIRHTPRFAAALAKIGALPIR